MIDPDNTDQALIVEGVKSRKDRVDQPQEAARKGASGSVTLVRAHTEQFEGFAHSIRSVVGVDAIFTRQKEIPYPFTQFFQTRHESMFAHDPATMRIDSGGTPP